MVGNWDTFLQQVEQWTQEIEKFMAHVDEARAAMLSSMALAPTTAGLWRPAVNMYETADTVVVQAELAGIASEDMTIQYDSGRLLIWGQRREIITSEAQTIHRLEIQSGRFAFRVQLPAAVDAEAAKATLLSAILEVRLAKRPTHRNGIIRLSLGEGERRSR
jgi:HSP20 family molecular chaperone IbpA